MNNNNNNKKTMAINLREHFSKEMRFITNM